MRNLTRVLVILGVTFALLLALGLPVAYVQAAKSNGEEVPYLIVMNGWKVPKKIARAVQKAGGQLTGTLDAIGVATAVSSDPGFAANMAKQKGVKDVSVDRYVQWLPDDLYVHDQPLVVENPPVTVGHNPSAAVFFPFQWNMRAIDADDAWAAGFQGDPSVTVAILDTGIDPFHLDTFGQVDFGRSTSFVENTGIPDPDIGLLCDDPNLINAFFPGAPPWVDLNFHGTHVAGIVAARGIAVSGVAPHVTLMAVKVLNVCGFGFFSWILAGIVWAADHDADVINMSLGVPGGIPKNEFPGFVSVVNKATTYANRKGTLVVASAGNEAANADKDGNTLFTPAQNARVMGISATGPTAAVGVNADTPASYTNFGHSLVDVAAPGGDFRRFPVGDWFLDLVLSPCSSFSIFLLFFGLDCSGGVTYLFVAGTSMSAPHASGVAALIDSNEGGDLRAGQLQTGVQRTADDLGKRGADPFYGHGRVNAFRAATEARP